MHRVFGGGGGGGGTVSSLPPPPPPPQLMHIHCFQFLLGITVVPREIADNGYVGFGRVRQGALSPM